MKDWVKMPSFLLKDKDNLILPEMKWIGDCKSDYIAALIIYIILIHESQEKEESIGSCSITYDKIQTISGLSRKKISGGIKALISKELINKDSKNKCNKYTISGFENMDKRGWAKLPAKKLYSKGKITAFHEFKLRVKHELNALKIYLLIATFRINETNYAKINYDTIHTYTGINRNDIKPALSFLVTLELIHVDEEVREDIGRYNIYRLKHLETYHHRGTKKMTSIPI